MLSFNLMPGLAAAMAGLAALAAAPAAWAQPLPQNTPALPVTITVQVPPSPRGAATTLTVEVSADLTTQHTDVKVTSDANPGAPAVLAASVGGSSVATVPVDANTPFTWDVQPANAPGCGPHPPAGAACSRSQSPQVAGVQTAPPATSPEAHRASAASAAPPLLLYTVQPGDTLTGVARHFYGDDAAVDDITQANQGRAMPDGRRFTEPDRIRPGWVLALPSPTRAVENRAGAVWYTVQPGDSLSAIAARLLGSSRRWPELYDLNRDRLSDGNLIPTGLQLRLPPSGQRLDDVAPDRRADVTPTPAAAAPAPGPAPAAAPNPQPRAVPPTAPVPVLPAAVSVAAILPAVAPAEPQATTPLLAPLTVEANHPAAVESAATPSAADASAPAVAAMGIVGAAVARGWRRASRNRAEAVACAPGRAPAVAISSGRVGPREQHRARVLEAVVAGTLRQKEAAAALGLSHRQLRRLLASFRSGGPAALVHGNTGRTPWQAVPEATRARVVELARTRYAGLSQAETARRLAAEHGIVLHRTTLARMLAGAGLTDAPTEAAAPVLPGPDAPSPAGHRCLGRGSVPGCHCV